MNALRETAAIILFGSGVLFMLVGSLGLVRLPDFFTRTHASGKVDSVGMMLCLGGLALHEGPTVSGLKLVLVIAFVAVSSPVAVHALARAAVRSGLGPWRPPGAGGARR
ncbi:monovalent cation/H(+) antiporter subunit G [Deferrisoma camini]|uniref:monovalent cation/H(+) antiporter subunit G n=1 Tax=Deferrisoma camini TaxID=1035120 RepID=UPI00046D4215|nr:monovalent cation/H(+) antiporter subunit G [Deferrisoma camini]